jgi:hypothetical protein
MTTRYRGCVSKPDKHGLLSFVPSDIRQMLAEIERLQTIIDRLNAYLPLDAA